jgi:hypothetical protein
MPLSVTPDCAGLSQAWPPDDEEPPVLRLDMGFGYGFDVLGLRGNSMGRLDGFLGVRTIALGRGRARVELTGELEWETREEEGGRVRITAKARGRPEVDVGVSLEPSPRDELRLALSGEHPAEWLRQTLADTGSRRWQNLCEALEAPAETLARFVSAWQLLRPWEEAALLGAACDYSELAGLREWLLRIHGERVGEGAGELLADLEQEWRSEPTFAASPLACWLEAAWARAPEAGFSASFGDALRRETLNAVAIVSRPAFKGILRRITALLGDLFPAIEGAWREGSSASLERLAASLLAAQVSGEVDERLAAGPVLDFSVEGPSSGSAIVSALRNGAPVDFERLRDAGLAVHGGALQPTLGRRRFVPVRLPYSRWTQGGVHAAWGGWEAGRLGGELALHPTGPHERMRELALDPVRRVLGGAFPPHSRADAVAPLLGVEFDYAAPLGDGWGALWDPLLEAYGLEAGSADRPAGLLRLQLSLPGECLYAWAHTPSLREPAYRTIFARLSLAVQRTLRLWLPAVAFPSVEALAPPGAALPLLAYSATMPRTGRDRGSFTLDPMDPATVRTVLHWSGRGLAARLRAISAALRETGQRELAATYSPARASAILAAVERSAKPLRRILGAEAQLVEELGGLAGRLRELRATVQHRPARALRQFEESSAETVKALHQHLRRLPAGTDLRPLAVLLLVEATHALESRLPLRVRLEFESANGKEVRLARRAAPLG